MTTDYQSTLPARTHVPARYAGLLLALGVGLLLRILLWGRIPRTGLISDEGEYLSAAHWLAQGRGFAWYLGYLWTRAPLYPLFLAAHIRLFGDTLTPVYITQTLFSLVNVALVYWLACCLFATTDDRRLTTDDRRPRSALHPAVAALLMAIYLPFALYTQVLLSETLYITLLLGGFLALALAGDQRPTNGNRRSPLHLCTFAPFHVIIAGALFGLATLTRSLTLGFVPLVALWLLFGQKSTQRVQRFCLFTFAFCLFLVPWTWYNSSRLYGGLVVVDTSGAYNLMLGARTATDGTRLDAPSRDFVRALLDPQVQKPAERTQLLAGFQDTNGQVIGQSCLLAQQDTQLLYAINRPAQQALLPQAQVQQLMTAEGMCLIRAHPLAFVQKSLGELVDFFQINYTGDERFTDAFTTGRLPSWYALALFLLDDTLYIVVLPLAVIGYALVRVEGQRQKVKGRHEDHTTPSPFYLVSFTALIGLWWLYTIAVAPLLFAINRFRLPLLPFAFIFAAYALVQVPRGWRVLRSRYGATMLALATVLALAATTPYAYLFPDNQALPSYFGPYPSSINDTQKAFAARQSYRNTMQLQQALHNGDTSAAITLLNGALTREGAQYGPVLLAARRGHYDDALNQLAQLQTQLERDARSNGRAVSDSDRVTIAVVRGDLLRSKGDLPNALNSLTPTLVDKSNPVQWAWNWLHPAPATEINIGGSIDIGYIEGCYLGEGDATLKPPANFRWCTDGARLRFPGAGTGAAQTLVLRADGRGWPTDMLPVPPVRVLLGAQKAGAFTPDHSAVKEFMVALPPTARGADVIVTLRTPTFIPDAADYLRQQGPLVGQVRQLGVRLDWARLQ